MLQAANTDLFLPISPKTHHSERQNLHFLYKKPLNVNLKLIGRLLFFAPSALRPMVKDKDWRMVSPFQLSYNLGSGEVVLENNMTRVDDGLWHRVKVTR